MHCRVRLFSVSVFQCSLTLSWHGYIQPLSRYAKFGIKLFLVHRFVASKWCEKNLNGPFTPFTETPAKTCRTFQNTKHGAQKFDAVCLPGAWPATVFITYLYGGACGTNIASHQTTVAIPYITDVAILRLLLTISRKRTGYSLKL